MQVVHLIQRHAESLCISVNMSMSYLLYLGFVSLFLSVNVTGHKKNITFKIILISSSKTF